MSTEEENKVLVRRFYDLLNLRDLDSVFELFDPGWISHYTTGNKSLEENRQFWPTIYTAFPDISLTFNHMVAEGDKVAFQDILRGTHKGEFMGIAPTGKKVEMISTCIVRIANGKLMESWCTLDELRLMQQLGAIPEQFRWGNTQELI
jgi:predicted ester cyclase